MGRRKKKYGKCPYCGNESKLTEDHIIPKCLFKPNTIKRAFKIDVCDECNNDEKSKDDSFLRDLIVADKDAHGSSTARFIYNEKFENSVKQNKSELNRNYLSNSKRVIVKTNSGLYTYGNIFSVENERLIRIFRRIITGLSLRTFNLSINEHAEITVFKKVKSIEEYNEDFELIIKNHSNGFYTGHNGHTFHFKVQFVIVNEKLHSYWWLIFYENVCYFLAIRSPFEIDNSL